MGMYDTVIVRCPKCSEEHEFQSKSGDCSLDVYTLEDCPDDVMVNVNRHSPYNCDCGEVFQVDIPTKKAVSVKESTNKDINIGESKVQFINNTNFKFILISYHNQKGFLTYTVMSDRLPFHFEILSRFNTYASQKGYRGVKIHGGGRLKIKDNTVTSHDKSVDYGIANCKILNTVMESFCKKKGFKYSCEIKSSSIFS